MLFKETTNCHHSSGAHRLSIMITIMIFFLEVQNSYGGHGTIPMLLFEIVCLGLQLEVRVGCLHFPVITFTIDKENFIKSIYHCLAAICIVLFLFFKLRFSGYCMPRFQMR